MQLGYYMRSSEPVAERIGWKGDFYTSSDVHPILGHALAKQAEQMDRLLGQPTSFTLVEMGPGKGLLAGHILSTCQRDYPALFHRLHYTLIERSPAMREAQRIHLAPWLQRPDLITWVDDLASIPPHSLTGLCLSNELVDSFPVHRIQLTAHGLEELWVDYRDGRFVECRKPLSSDRLAAHLRPIGSDWTEGYRTEVNLHALDWMAQVAQRLARGFVLTIDYGHTAQHLYSIDRKHGTFLCYRQHTVHENPFLHVGEQDMTAHVDFSSLATAGEEQGLRTTGFTNQMSFLIGLGIEKIEHKAREESEKLAVQNAEREVKAEADRLAKRKAEDKQLANAKAKDEADQIPAQAPQWSAVAWITLGWTIGFLFIAYNFRDYYNNRGYTSPVDTFMGALGGAVIGLGIALTLKAHNTISNWKSMLWIPLIAAISFSIAVVTGEPSQSLATNGAIYGAIGGFGIAFVLRNVHIVPNWKSMLWISLFFAVGSAAGLGTFLFFFFNIDNPITSGVIGGIIGVAISADPSVASPIGAQAEANYAKNPIPEIPPSQFKVGGGLTFLDDGHPRRWESDKNNFQPRIGFAYQANEKTVVRGGWGLYTVTNLPEGFNQAGFSQSTNIVPSLDNGLTFLANLSNPFPTGVAEPPGSSLGAATFLGRALDPTLPAGPRPNEQHMRWSIGFQRELPGQWVFEAKETRKGVVLSWGLPLFTSFRSSRNA